MTEREQNHNPDWATLLQRIRLELDTLDEVERGWLNERITAIASLQIALDELFVRAGGMTACAGCEGACCGCGRHHVTLTNLLAYLLEGETPPAPDFSVTCPFLGELGCRLPVGRRPYNCITFFCETLEDSLDAEQCGQLRTLDRELRKEYQQVADRYPAASLRGIWIALERIDNGRLLRPIDSDMLK